jgi:signal transduction histidine kinase
MRLWKRRESVFPASQELISLAGGHEAGGQTARLIAMEGLMDRATGAGEAKEILFRTWDQSPEVESLALGSNEVFVLLSMPFPDWIGSICVICKRGDTGTESATWWATQLAATLTFVVDRINRYLLLDLSTKERTDFYNELSAVACSRPTVDLPRLCGAWKKHSGADWVWLWLYNETAKQWELVGCAPIDTADFIPEKLITPSQNCVAEYCCRMSRHEFVKDPENWKAQEEKTGEEFRVVLGGLLKDLGCVALDCVPLLSSPPNGVESQTAQYPQQLRLRGAVCLYYRDLGRRRDQPSEVYRLLGRLSASTLIDSYEAEQRHILFSLNNLTEKYLTKTSIRPLERRAEYLRHLHKLISTHLNVEFVSIFWRDPFHNKLVCLETTGLWDANGKPIPIENSANVKYDIGKGQTGKVFATGIPEFSPIGDVPNVKPFSTEIPPELNPRDVAWIVCPIPFFTGGQISQNALPVPGVVRCAVTKAMLAPKRARNFDSIQLEELSFITRQVAPVLEAMAANITREITVSVIRHDLFAPLRMILDTAEELGRDLQKGRKPADYAISDLTMSVYMAEQLVKQLDLDPTNVSRLTLKPTHLEGDIIARLKAMLGHYAKQEADMKIVFGDFRRFPCLKIDRTLIERVFHNLIMNAIKYGREGTEIRVMPLMMRDSLVVAVSNYGIGVEPNEAELLFSGNYRSPRAQLRSQGLGLGLKISKAAIEVHGGRLELTQAKEPTIFSVVFPKEVITQE